MKNADDLLDEVLLYVVPPAGVSMRLSERSNPGQTNWVLAMGVAPDRCYRAFAEKVSELRRSSPYVEWSAVAGEAGERSITRYLSEAESRRYAALSA
jgi:hypothetical protein